jgi:hypothetical protein
MLTPLLLARAQVARGLLLVQNVLAAMLAVLQRNQPATKLGDERVSMLASMLEFVSRQMICRYISITTVQPYSH